MENLTNLRKPYWLKSNKLGTKKTGKILKYLREYNLHTVCESARCPNKGECFDRGTATFMILGNVCMRNCTFCAVEKGVQNIPEPDINEPVAIADLSHKLSLKHIVITTVTRDDLIDGGASQFGKVINEIRKKCYDTTIEVLISDLKGEKEHLEKIINAKPDVLNHNVETIPRLYSEVRPMADYNRSLSILSNAKKIDKEMITKSGLMVGLGETEKEILHLMEDLRKIKVDIITIGQYIAPTKKHFPVKEYVHPDVFEFYKNEGLKMGFRIVESAPLVRSSYHAEKVRKIIKKQSQTNYL